MWSGVFCIFHKFSIMPHGCWNPMCVYACWPAIVRALFSAVSSNYQSSGDCQFWGDAMQPVRSASRQLGSEMSFATTEMRALSCSIW